MRDYRRQLRALRARLGPARTAEEAVDRLLLDVLITPADLMPGAMTRRYQAARRRWPGDADVAWLSVAQCIGDCDHGAEVGHLLAVDPDNAAAWIQAMAVARARHDDAGLGYALQRASRATVYDPHAGTVFLQARAVLAQVAAPDTCTTPEALADLQSELGRPAPGDDVADLMAITLEFVSAIPPSVVPECGVAEVPEPRRGQCRALLSLVVQSDRLIDQLLAVRGLLALEPDPARSALLRERYRRLRWLGAHQAPPLPAHYATRMWSEGEVALLRSLAIEQHRWPPPSDWLPDDPGSRALVKGETAPRP